MVLLLHPAHESHPAFLTVCETFLDFPYLRFCQRFSLLIQFTGQTYNFLCFPVVFPQQTGSFNPLLLSFETSNQRLAFLAFKMSSHGRSLPGTVRRQGSKPSSYCPEKFRGMGH